MPVILRSALVAALAVGVAQASPAVVVLGLDPAGADARAFAQGARSIQPSTEGAEAEAALRRAEQAFLELDFAAAQADLTTAVQYDLGAAERPIDARRAFQAAVRLAQVLLARRRPKAADQLLAQAVATWPGFPGDVVPPPDVGRRLDRVKRQRGVGRRLTIASRPDGLRARFNGVEVGRTPVRLAGLVPGPHVVCVEGRFDSHCRSVDVGTRAQVTLQAGSPVARQSLANSVHSQDAEAGWSAVADLEAALARESTCVASVSDGEVLVARLSGRQRAVLGGRVLRQPEGPTGWAALGRYCGPDAPSDRGPAEVVEALWGAPAGGSGLSKAQWGWVSVGAGVAAVGLGVGLGVAANGAADAYNRGGDPADEDAARGFALGADVAYVSSALLVGLGVALLLWD